LRNRIASGVLISVLVLTSLAAWADLPNASISGTITDNSGGVIVGATISARNIETKIVSTTTSNDVGAYRLVGLQAGWYEISTSRPQFTTVVRKDVILRVGDDIRIDVRLPTGEARDSVVVTETTPLTEADTAGVSTVVNAEAIEDLPSDGRQLQNLAL